MFIRYFFIVNLGIYSRCVGESCRFVEWKLEKNLGLHETDKIDIGLNWSKRIGNFLCDSRRNAYGNYSFKSS
jgi:hypothetical protein